MLGAARQPVEIIWKVPLKEVDRDEKINVVDNFIARGVDGMVLAPLDDKALVSPVETAGKADIPVVIIDSGLQTDKYASFVATDNALGGRMGGALLVKVLGGTGLVLLMPPSHNYISEPTRPYYTQVALLSLKKTRNDTPPTQT